MTTAVSTEFSAEAAGALPGPAWLVDRRRREAERFAITDLPTPEEEVWRYSRIADLDLAAFAPLPSDTGPSAQDDELLDLASSADLVVVTVDGRLAHTSTSDGCRATVGVPDSEEDSAIGAALGRATDALTVLHDAFCEPVEIDVPEGAEIRQIVVVHQSTRPDVASFPRLVVRARQAARLSVVEVHSSPAGLASLSLPVTELVVGRDASVRHASVQVLGDASWQIARLASTVEQGGYLRAGTAAFGGDYSRLRVDTDLTGRGAHGDLYAGYFGSGKQLLDFRTFQDHTAADTTSNLLFKGALAGAGASVYTGLIKIRPQARGSQAFQTNRNIKLSDDAWAESVPNLEIENNEVQCSHASTVGPIDAEQLFYLESRGVPTERAERLIVKGAFDEVFDALPLGPYEPVVRQTLDGELARSLS
jgi:Fe-S cluster assembly protein SufD